MTNVVSLLSKSPLLGEWVVPEDGSSVLYTVRASPAGFEVYARDLRDGEIFPVTEVSWDGERLRFSVHIQSTGWKVMHAVKLLDDGRLTDQVTAHFASTLVRRE